MAIDLKRAAALRKLADGLTSQIEDRRRPMTQNPTPKRLREYNSRLHDAANLERAQRALLALAKGHATGRIPAELAALRTKDEIRTLMRHGLKEGGYYDCIPSGEYADKSPLGRALQQFTDAAATPEQALEDASRKREDDRRRFKESLRMANIPGYFPTPAALADRVVELADIQPGMSVLEPSAGSGALAEAIMRAEPAVALTCIERHSRLADYLSHDYPTTCADFLEWNTDGAMKFQRIVANPPFDKGADIKHIRHMMTMLVPDGRIVAICSPGPRQQKAIREFASQWIDVPSGTFAQSGTNVASVIAVFDEADLRGRELAA